MCVCVCVYVCVCVCITLSFPLCCCLDEFFHYHVFEPVDAISTAHKRVVVLAHELLELVGLCVCVCMCVCVGGWVC